ncbi:hypothetical protein L7F22_034662 [Adiantum nelumboides]|nr:hypothetical protein [Adiantum nelumboides]
MHSEFGKTLKQGVDLWSKVATQLASLFPECDKDRQACRKKWGRVYDAYKKDKSHNSISGNDRRVTCEWYDIVDEYMHGRANVVRESHASAIGEAEDFEIHETANMESDANIPEDGGDGASTSIAKSKTQATIQGSRQCKDRVIEDSLLDMASTVKSMAAN